MTTYLSIETPESVDVDIVRLTTLFAALAHPKRLTLILALAERELCVCELVDLLGLPQPLISHHLAALRNAGLVRDRRDAHWVYYSLAPDSLDDVRRALGRLFPVESLPPGAAFGANTRC